MVQASSGTTMFEVPFTRTGSPPAAGADDSNNPQLHAWRPHFKSGICGQAVVLVGLAAREATALLTEHTAQ